MGCGWAFERFREIALSEIQNYVPLSKIQHNSHQKSKELNFFDDFYKKFHLISSSLNVFTFNGL